MSFSIITVLDGNNQPALDPATGLQVKRQCVRFVPDGDITRLTIFYKQWLSGIDGSQVDVKEKAYYLYDAPAVYYTGNEIKTDATFYAEGEDMGGGVLANGGEVKTPPVYYLNTDIKTAEKVVFSHWKNFTILQQFVGLTLEQLFIEMQINPKLKIMPINVVDFFDVTI